MSHWSALKKLLPHLDLTPGQRRVAQLLIAGKSEAEIASITGLSGLHLKYRITFLAFISRRRQPPEPLGAMIFPKHPFPPTLMGGQMRSFSDE